MELNEKIEQRRRELAKNAAQAAQAQAQQRQDEARKAEEVKRAEGAAVDAEVARRLAEMGVPPPAPKPLPKSVVAPAKLVEAEVEKAISKAANARMTGGENAVYLILLLLGVGGFFVEWWIGVAFLVWALSYIGKKTTRYKEQIIAEGKAKITKGARAGEQDDQITAFAVVLLSAGKNKVASIQVVRQFTDYGLRESKDIVDRAPTLVMQGMSATYAEALKRQLELVGATAEVKYCTAFME